MSWGVATAAGFGVALAGFCIGAGVEAGLNRVASAIRELAAAVRSQGE